MHQIITAKLKLNTTPEQRALLRQAQLAYRDALNYASRYAFEHGKTSNEELLHKETYYDIRAQFGLPSEMTNNAIRLVAATYRGLWTGSDRIQSTAGSRSPGNAHPHALPDWRGMQNCGGAKGGTTLCKQGVNDSKSHSYLRSK